MAELATELRALLSQHGGRVDLSDLPRLYKKQFGRILRPSSHGCSSYCDLVATHASSGEPRMPVPCRCLSRPPFPALYCPAVPVRFVTTYDTTLLPCNSGA